MDVNCLSHRLDIADTDTLGDCLVPGFSQPDWRINLIDWMVGRNNCLWGCDNIHDFSALRDFISYINLIIPGEFAVSGVDLPDFVVALPEFEQNVFGNFSDS